VAKNYAPLDNAFRALSDQEVRHIRGHESVGAGAQQSKRNKKSVKTPSPSSGCLPWSRLECEIGFAARAAVADRKQEDAASCFFGLRRRSPHSPSARPSISWWGRPHLARSARQQAEDP